MVAIYIGSGPASIAYAASQFAYNIHFTSLRRASQQQQGNREAVKPNNIMNQEGSYTTKKSNLVDNNLMQCSYVHRKSKKWIVDDVTCWS